ncbi:Uncharacterised protein [Mycobacteroides abscessus subsp. abscessus]|nr:Uncharacterised protein [Mycobacteroides abscessus subsp. abscessus]
MPIPIPSRAKQDNTNSPPVEFMAVRAAIPMTVATTAANVVRSSPNRSVSAGVTNPATANMAVGSIPNTPITAEPNPISCEIWVNSGLNEVTAERRQSANSRIAASTIRRPRRNAAAEITWVSSRRVAVTVHPPQIQPGKS